MGADGFQSRGPATRTERGPWTRIIDADGLGTRQAVTFAREVAWVRVGEARVGLVDRSGRDASAGVTFSDLPGDLLSCLSPAVGEARALVARLGGRRGSRVQVRVTVRDLPSIRLPPERWDTEASSPRYMRVPADWIAHGDAATVTAWLAKDQEGRMADLHAVRHIDAEVVVDGVPAWLSSNDRFGNLAALEGVLRAATAGLSESGASLPELDRGLANH